jgi:hypothetical protein
LHVLGKRSTSGYTSSLFFARLKGFLHTWWMKEGKTVELWWLLRGWEWDLLPPFPITTVNLICWATTCTNTSLIAFKCEMIFWSYGVRNQLAVKHSLFQATGQIGPQFDFLCSWQSSSWGSEIKIEVLRELALKKHCHQSRVNKNPLAYNTVSPYLYPHPPITVFFFVN